MARQPSKPTTIDHAKVSQEVSDNLNTALSTSSARSQEIMDAYGDGLVYHRARVVDETRFYMAQSAETMLEAGKRLIILKEHEPHGEFIHIVESHLGMAARTAQQIMQAAVKYCSPTLEPKRQALAALGKTKLFELMVEDDDDLSELADGGSVAGITLDDIDRMSVRELKKALRNAREDRQAKDRVMEKQRAAINELETKTELLKTLEPDAAAQQLRTEASKVADEVESQIRIHLTHTLEQVLEQGITDQDNPLLENTQADWLTHRLDLLDDALLHLRGRLGIERTRPMTNEPVWADPHFDDDNPLDGETSE